MLGGAPWYSAKELAQLRLPGLPWSQQGIAAWVARDSWNTARDASGELQARRRAGRGGGWEYHSSLLPEAAQQALAARAAPIAPSTPIVANDTAQSSDERWQWFDGLNDTAKDRARSALSIVQRVEALMEDGRGKTGAIRTVAAERSVGASTIQTYFAAIAGVARHDRLAYLAPSYKGGGREADIDAGAWQILRSDWLRLEKSSFMETYNRVVELYARPRGIVLPCAKTVLNRLKKEVPHTLKVLKREGREAARRSVPPQRRTVADLHAMEAVNVDGHTFDVFVQWEDGSIGRPVVVGIQDIYSRKLLAWEMDRTESTLLSRIAFMNLFRDHGIPKRALMDNGRAFASKALTGGVPTRYRFKVKDTDALGVLPSLGIAVTWAKPYRGSSKPIERFWGALAKEASKHPAVAGAYTGNKPDAKPENYGSRAIPIADFKALAASVITRINARAGRRTEMANGGSYDDVFEESRKANPVGQATAEHLRLALLTAQDRRCDRESGAVKLYGNVYWSPALSELAGQMMVVRFDPNNLHSEIHLYHRDGRYFGVAPVQEMTGFFEQAGSVRRDKLEADARRKLRDAEAAQDLLNRDRLAELLAETPMPAPVAPVVPVTRMVRHRGQTAAALKPLQQDAVAPAVPDFTDTFGAGVERRLRIVPD